MKKAVIFAWILALATSACCFIGCGDPTAHTATVYVTSDIHSNFSGLDKHMQLLAQTESVMPSHVLTGGDYFVMGDNPGMEECFSAIRTSAQKHFSNDTQLTVTMGNHDWQAYSLERFEEESGTKNVGEQASTQLFTVYTLGYPDGNNYTGGGIDYYSDSVIDGLDEYLTDMDGSGKVVFIQSHITIHTGKNGMNGDRAVIGSDKMVDMLNGHADEVDIVFFWGHCHSAFEKNKRSVKQRGDTITCAGGKTSAVDKEIKFTYANSGAMLNYDSNQSAAYLTFDKNDITIKYYVLSPDQETLSLESSFTVERI